MYNAFIYFHIKYLHKIYSYSIFCRCLIESNNWWHECKDQQNFVSKN